MSGGVTHVVTSLVSVPSDGVPYRVVTACGLVLSARPRILPDAPPCEGCRRAVLASLVEAQERGGDYHDSLMYRETRKVRWQVREHLTSAWVRRESLPEGRELTERMCEGSAKRLAEAIQSHAVWE